MVRGWIIGNNSGLFLGMFSCIALIVFIFTMRAFDHKVKRRFIYGATALLIAMFGTIIYSKSGNIIVTVLSYVLPFLAIGILFLYMYMYAARYNIDSVSRCYKRRCFYADAERHSKNKMAIISMDLNDLKYINDNFGHKAGDIALLTFAEVCRSVKSSKFILYRTGGDEFMMLGIKATKEEAEELIHNIRLKLQETPYTCSFGINMYNPSDDFDDVVVKADQAMYEDKRMYKEMKIKANPSKDEEYDESLRMFTSNISFLD